MYILGRCSPDQDLLLINKSVPPDFMESLLCHSGLFWIILILSGAYGDVFLLENVYIFSEMVVFYKRCVSQMYGERAVSLPLAGDLCRHMAWHSLRIRQDKRAEHRWHRNGWKDKGTIQWAAQWNVKKR